MLSGTATDVSGNGDQIVGNGLVGTGHDDLDISILVLPEIERLRLSRALIWDENRQVHDLQEWLIKNYQLGDQLSGWSLTSASAISANGQVIAGVGVNPAGDLQGWVVSIPEPSSWVLSGGFCIVMLLARRVHPLLPFPPSSARASIVSAAGN